MLSTDDSIQQGIKSFKKLEQNKLILSTEDSTQQVEKSFKKLWQNIIILSTEDLYIALYSGKYGITSS